MPSPTERARPVLLFGSSSNERLVSVASAQLIERSLAARPWFWTPEGEVVEIDPARLRAHTDPFTSEFSRLGEPRWPGIEAAFDSLVAATAGGEPPVVVLALHGGEGEDGSVQALLEARGLPFTGSRSAASALAFDKPRALTVARDAGLRTAPRRLLSALDRQSAAEAIALAFDELGPSVVKIARGGSSLQLAFVRQSEADLAGAAELLSAHPGVTFVCEQLIVGRELTVGVIERGGREIVLPFSEVVTEAGRTFDYAGKYLGQGSLEITPATVDAALATELERASIAVHRAIGCRGYSRSDFMVDERGPVYLETNTLPGLSPRSFIPQQLAVAGIEFSEFLQDQIELARELR